MTLRSQTTAGPEAGVTEHALTPLQLGMVYESALAGRPWVNLEQVVVHLEDESVDAEALRAAWALVAARHAGLRLSILWRKRLTPVQVLRNRVEVALTVEDWSALPPRRREGMLAQYLEADREQGVDLEGAPAWRVMLAHLGPKRSVMVWTVHHAMADGRSMAIVLEEVFAALKGAALPPAPEVGFLDYAKGLAEQDTTAAQQFFRDYLTGFDQPNPLRDGTVDTGLTRKRQIEQRLDRRLSGALSQRAEAAGVTLATVVQAAWGLVVARWTGRAGAVFGTTRAGRHIVPGTQRTVGCLINTLPMMVQISPPRATDAFLTGLRRDSLALRAHEHAALTDVRRWCGLSGSETLFDSMVMFERSSLDEALRALGPEWARRRVELREEGALPLALAAYGDAELLLVLEHDPAVVSEDKARAMLGHLAEVLAALAKAGTTTPLSHLTMLPRPEEAALLALGRPERRLPQVDPCVSLRFADRVFEQPEAPALKMVGAPEQLNFAMLEARVGDLAGRLVQAGVGPGQIVAICLPRTPQFVVAMLAVLRVGAAFLPLDPGYPAPVLRHMLTDSGAGLMLAPPGQEVPPGVRRMSPEPEPGLAVVPPDLLPPDPDRLAYVIYTSGSTGVPKGVKVPMRALSAHASAIIAGFGLTPGDRVLQFASLSFDVSIEEIIPTLLAGAKVILRNAEMAGSVGLFLEEVARQGITVLNLPTAFWHVLVDEMARDGLHLPQAVRLVVVGGEQISPRALATWRRIAPRARWLNGYGPTETTITCTLHEPGTLTAGEDIPIGRPTAHARAYVLAPDGSLAPTGAVGELWIGGVAVSDGYIGHEAQMAEAFRPDRFHGEGLIYRTGDMARWRPDGALAFHGRRDRQVKLRGFRIDLRHVEQVLEREASVGRALAHVLGAGTPVARLVVWVAAAEGQPLPEADALRAAVADHLPPHMLPAILTVASFPRTPGGKIDIAALPVPDTATATEAASTSDDPVTQKIAALMAQTLGLASVGPDDDFHALGGHSLLAVQLIGRIEAELGHRLGVADLHRRPTPRALARALSAAQAGPRYIIPIQPKGSRPPLFGVHVLGRNEEHFRPLAAALGPDQPVFGLTVGLLAQDTPIGVQETARAYAEEIQRHFPQGPVSLAAVSLASYVAYELAQQLIRAGREVRVIAMFDSAGPGGRSRLSGRARLGVHLRQLYRRGPSHLAGILANRWADVVYRSKKVRLRLRNRRGPAEPMTVEGFMVAAELAVQEYEVRPIHRPLTIFRAEANVFDSPESARDGLGWAAVAASGFEVIDVPGDHLSILQPPNVAQLSHHLSRLMADLPEA